MVYFFYILHRSIRIINDYYMKSKNPVSATILNFTWNIPTHWLLAVEHLFGGRFAGSNYIGTEVYL